MILLLLQQKKTHFLTGLLTLMLVSCISEPDRQNSAKVQTVVQPLTPQIKHYLEQQINRKQVFFPATPTPEGKTILSTIPNGENLAEIKTFVQQLNPQMERYLEQQLNRRQIFFAATSKLEGKSIHLAVPRQLERETVFNITITYENTTPILKGKVFTREQKELIEKVAAKSFKNQVRSQLASFPYDDIEADYGITLKPLSNLYVKPRQEGSDNLATQVRLGTPVKLLEYSPDKKFVRVRIEDDGYIAWIPRQELIECDRATFKSWINSPKVLLANTIKQPKEIYFATQLRFVKNQNSANIEALLPSKSLKLIAQPKETNTNSLLKPQIIQLKSQNVFLSKAPATPSTLIEIAKQFLPSGKQGRVTYLWGGVVGNQLDCSGYVQTVFRAGNIDLPRDADQQKFYTQPVAPTLQKIDDLQSGDLVFFSKNRRDTTHVGIYIGNYQFIHSARGGAYSGVKISRLKDGDNYDKYLQTLYFGGGRIPKFVN